MSLATVLVLLGVYGPVISAVRGLLGMDFSYIVPIAIFAICVIIGLMATAKGVKYIFNKFPGFSNTTVLGFQFGSLISIAYQSHQIVDPNFTWLLGGVMLVVGFGISIMFMFLGKMMNKSELED